MTAYFDDLRTRVRALSDESGGSPVTFLEGLMDLEERVIKAVSICTGDIEFPADLREKVQGLVSRWRLRGNPNGEALRAATTFFESQLFEELHRAFHTIAQRRIKTRFGLLSDSPDGNVYRRDCHDLKLDIQDPRFRSTLGACPCCDEFVELRGATARTSGDRAVMSLTAECGHSFSLDEWVR